MGSDEHPVGTDVREINGGVRELEGLVWSVRHGEAVGTR